MFSSQRLFKKNYVNSTGRCSAHKLALMKFLVNPLSSKSCSRADSWFSMTGDLWCLIFSLSFLTCAEANLTIVFIIWLYFPYYITVWCMRWQKIRGIVCSDFPSTRYLKRLYSLKVKSFVSFFSFFLVRGLRCSWEGLALLDSILPALLVELERQISPKASQGPLWVCWQTNQEHLQPSMTQMFIKQIRSWLSKHIKTNSFVWYTF